VLTRFAFVEICAVGLSGASEPLSTEGVNRGKGQKSSFIM